MQIDKVLRFGLLQGQFNADARYYSNVYLIDINVYPFTTRYYTQFCRTVIFLNTDHQKFSLVCCHCASGQRRPAASRSCLPFNYEATNYCNSFIGLLGKQFYHSLNSAKWPPDTSRSNCQVDAN